MRSTAINRWLFTGVSIERLAGILSDIGFNSVELTAWEVLNKSHEDLESIWACLHAHEIEVSAINAVVSFVPYIHGSITDKISWRRKEFLRVLENIIEKMHIIDCHRLIVSPGRQAENYQTRDEAWRTTVESLRHLGKYGSRYNVEILVEAMPFRGPFKYSRDIRGLVEEAGQPYVYASMDTGHVALAGEDLKVAAETLGKHLHYLHLSNVKIELGRPLLDEHRPLYDGTISIEEFAGLLSMLKDAPLAINVVTLNDPIICAKRCLQLIGNSRR